MRPPFQKNTSKLATGQNVRGGNGSRRVAQTLNEALVHHQKGALSQALMGYEKVLKIEPKNFEALHLSGLIALQRKDPMGGAKLMRDALRINPQSVPCLVNLGLAEHAIGAHSLALELYAKAIKLKKDTAQAYYNAANVYKDLKDWAKAVEFYETAISLQPAYLEALLNCGVALESAMQFMKALLRTNQAIALNSIYGKAYNNRGNINKKLERWESSLQDYECAISLDQNYVDAFINKGNLLKDTGYWTLAQQSYQRAFNLEPENPRVQWNLSLMHLIKGEFKIGWIGYEARLLEENINVLSPHMIYMNEIRASTPWRGEGLGGGHILSSNQAENPQINLSDTTSKKETDDPIRLLIYAEQGLGDTIQFVRFVPNLVKKLINAKLSFKYILAVQKPLILLLTAFIKERGLLDTVDVIELEGKLPKFEVSCPLMSLPLALGVVRESEFQSSPYLISNPSLVSWWANKLGEKNKRRIGVVWRGSAYHVNDKYRSLELSRFANLFRSELQWVSLQKDINKDEKEILEQFGVQDFSDALNDFSDTAALSAQLDLVICVDTSVAHLCAAAGQEVWLLLQLSPDWRWMLDRVDSPWYSKIKIYRQSKWGDWSGVLSKVLEDLIKVGEHKL
jgi:tetratricopeptide (TPR) repeat protein